MKTKLIASLEEEILDMKNTIESYGQKIKQDEIDVNKSIRSEQKIWEELARRHRDWITYLRKTDKFGVTIEEPGRGDSNDKFIFKPEPYDFFERLRVIEDLRHERSPQWPKIPKERILAIAEEHSLELPGHMRSDQTHNEFFNRIYISVFILSAVVPMLAIAFKLTLPARLKQYYAQGSYEADSHNTTSMDSVFPDEE